MKNCNFKWKEVVKSDTAKRLGIKNIPSEEDMNCIMEAVVGIQKVRDLLGVPMIVTSWFRCEELNKAVGGSKTSAHRFGYAVDFIPKGIGLDEAFHKIKTSDIVFDQLLIETRKSDGARWIHISFDPKCRKQCKELRV